MADPAQTTTLIARCGLCTFHWAGPRSRLAAQRHANKTGHPVEVIASVQATVQPSNPEENCLD